MAADRVPGRARRNGSLVSGWLEVFGELLWASALPAAQPPMPEAIYVDVLVYRRRVTREDGSRTMAGPKRLFVHVAMACVDPDGPTPLLLWSDTADDRAAWARLMTLDARGLANQDRWAAVIREQLQQQNGRPGHRPRWMAEPAGSPSIPSKESVAPKAHIHDGIIADRTSWRASKIGTSTSRPAGCPSAELRSAQPPAMRHERTFGKHAPTLGLRAGARLRGQNERSLSPQSGRWCFRLG